MHCKMLCIIGKLQAVRVSQLILVMPVTLVFFIKIPRQTSMSKSQRKPGAPSTDPPSALSQSGQLWGPQMLYTILYVWETTSLHSTQPEDAKDTALGCQKAAFKSGMKIFSLAHADQSPKSHSFASQNIWFNFLTQLPRVGTT